MPWDYTETEYAKQKAADPEWHLERTLNYGLEGEKLDRATLEKLLPRIRIPDDRRAFLELLVWNKPF